MEAHARSRRAALTAMLKLGAGVLAAGTVGCAPEAITRTQEPSGATAASPPWWAAPVGSPAPAMATATPTQPAPRAADVRASIIARSLTIPTLSTVDTPVEQAGTTRGPDGKVQIVVPESGLVTPHRVMGRNAINNIWILGHSRWRGVPQLLFTLAGINIGDPVSIAGFDQTRQRDLPSLGFEVERILLTDAESATKEIYGVRPRFPRLVIQTSARQNGDIHWILGRRTVEAKAQTLLDSSVNDPRKYLLLLIVAQTTPASRELLAG